MARHHIRPMPKSKPKPPRCTSFPPELGPRSRVLILGSMPGARSLAQREYYAHPQNRFWHVMDALCGAGPKLPYAQRIARLVGAGFALWDVLKHCEREGSLDGSIVRDSEVPNAIASLLERERGIVAVAFNGGKAREAFQRYVLPGLSSQRRESLALVALPSTSPANASIPNAEKLARWRELKRFVRTA